MKPIHKAPPFDVELGATLTALGDLLNPTFTMYEVKDQRWVPVERFSGLPR